MLKSSYTSYFLLQIYRARKYVLRIEYAEGQRIEIRQNTLRILAYFCNYVLRIQTLQFTPHAQWDSLCHVLNALVVLHTNCKPFLLIITMTILTRRVISGDKDTKRRILAENVKKSSPVTRIVDITTMTAAMLKRQFERCHQYQSVTSQLPPLIRTSLLIPTRYFPPPI